MLHVLLRLPNYMNFKSTVSFSLFFFVASVLLHGDLFSCSSSPLHHVVLTHPVLHLMIDFEAFSNGVICVTAS